MQRSNPKVAAFYQSTAWKKTRKAFILSKFGICERCGEPATYVHHKEYITSNNIDDVNITLNWNNLELLCHECHNIIHFKTQIPYNFDEEGNLISYEKVPQFVSK